MDPEDIELLERYVDKYGLEEVLSGLSFICGEKAEHIAHDWQDVGLAQIWIRYSRWIDQTSAKTKKLQIACSA